MRSNYVLAAVMLVLLAATYMAGRQDAKTPTSQLVVPASIQYNIARGFDCWYEIDPVQHTSEWLCK